MALIRSLLIAFAAASACAASPAAVAAEPAKITVTVVPRVGLFNEVQYTRRGKANSPPPPIVADQYAKWSPMGVADFMQSVDPSTRELIESNIGQDWELLTTYEPARSYKTRKARVAIKADRVLGCSASVDGHGIEGTVEGSVCRLVFDVQTNAAAKVPVSYRTSDSPLPVEGVASIPQDYLVVIAGDSYASGEGNPDRPANCSWYELFHCTAEPLWMDDECHRSFWSAGMRSALRLVGEDAERRGGAYTIFNVACSGAGMSRGLLDNYEGVVPIKDITKRFGDQLGLGTLPASVRRVPPQMATLADLVHERQGADTGIDLLVLSAGGNDLEFGAVVLETLIADRKQEWIDATRDELKKRLREYDDALATFAQKLRQLPVQQIVWVPYPNVTDQGYRKEVTTACAGGPLGALSKFESFKISSIEQALAYSVLVEELNGTNYKFASDQRLYILDRDDVDRTYFNRGWCSPQKPTGPYASDGGRLIRKLDESKDIQDSIHGTMHPTSEAHALVSRLIDSVLARARQEAVAIDVGEAPAGQDGRNWVRSPMRVSIKSAGPGPSPHEVCPAGPGVGFDRCRPGALDLDVSGPTLGATKVMTVHAATKRRNLQPLPNRAVDSTPPSIKPCLQKRGAAQFACGSDWVLAGDELELTATDSESGLQGIVVSLLEQPDVALKTRPVAAGAVLSANDLPPGLVNLVVRASDRVGNIASQQLPLLKVVKRVPELPRVSIHGAALTPSQLQRPIPVSSDSLEIGVSVAATDAPIAGLVLDVAGETQSPREANAFDGLKSKCGVQGASPSSLDVTFTHRLRDTESAFAISAMDCATQHSAIVQVNLLRTRAGKPALIQVSGDARRPGAITGDQRRAVMRMTSLFGAAPSADDPSFGIFTAWLDIVAGRLSPADRIAVRVTPDCRVEQPAGADGQSVYAVLMATEACASGLAAGSAERDDFLGKVSAQLNGSTRTALALLRD